MRQSSFHANEVVNHVLVKQIEGMDQQVIDCTLYLLMQLASLSKMLMLFAWAHWLSSNPAAAHPVYNTAQQHTKLDVDRLFVLEVVEFFHHELEVPTQKSSLNVGQ